MCERERGKERERGSHTRDSLVRRSERGRESSRQAYAKKPHLRSAFGGEFEILLLPLSPFSRRQTLSQCDTLKAREREREREREN